MGLGSWQGEGEAFYGGAGGVRAARGPRWSPVPPS